MELPQEFFEEIIQDIKNQAAEKLLISKQSDYAAYMEVFTRHFVADQILSEFRQQLASYIHNNSF